MASAETGSTHTFVTAILAIRVPTVISILITASPGEFDFPYLDTLYHEL